jgi:hypothetical protein
MYGIPIFISEQVEESVFMKCKTLGARILTRGEVMKAAVVGLPQPNFLMIHL